MAQFHIQTQNGPAPVDGLPYVQMIGGREARLFLHIESPLEGPRLSCQRTGMTLANIAPFLLSRYVQTGHSDGPLESPKVQRLGAALALQSLIARHGAEKLWQVMDSAPALA